jgi:hypothetical protein
MKYAKYMLGVHKSATNITVLAELGLYPLSIAALKSSVIYCVFLVFYDLILFPPDLLSSLNNNVFQCSIYLFSNCFVTENKSLDFEKVP